MDRQSTVHESLRETLEACRENASAVGSHLELVLIARRFFSVNSISEIARLGLKYIMPCPRNGRVKG